MKTIASINTFDNEIEKDKVSFNVDGSGMFLLTVAIKLESGSGQEVTALVENPWKLQTALNSAIEYWENLDPRPVKDEFPF